MTTVHVLRRMVLVVFSAATLFGMSVSASAQGERDNGRHEDKQEDKANAKQDKKNERDAKHDDRQGHQPPGQEKKEQRRDAQEQQELIRQHEQRLTQYQDLLDRQQRAGQQHAARLEQQRRQAQHKFQQEYLARLREQQARVQAHDRYDYDHDPFFYTRPQYRYSHDGRRFETNQYGLDVLRQAVNVGYEQGFRAGQADREDRWPSNYRDSYAYQDANYGYGGFYVDRDDYNYYFREGFSRGYEDGYGSRPRYGTSSNGKMGILADVLAGIISYETIGR